MNKFINKIIWLILIAPAIYLALVWNKLPEKVAMHFDLKGNVDRFGSKNELIILTAVLTAVSAAIYLLLPLAYKIDPKRNAGENKTRLHRLAFVISTFMAAILFLLIYSSAHDNMKLSSKFIFAGVGILFCFIGNYMHNIKPNYFAGFRLPWTLENENNWRKTHLLGGKLFFAGGLLITIISLITPVTVTIILFLIITIAITVITCIYSYDLYKKQKSINHQQ
ncbi:MAG: SdpI family protein [Bacteroidota bacterium]